jgi:hypothetical protein
MAEIRAVCERKQKRQWQLVTSSILIAFFVASFVMMPAAALDATSQNATPQKGGHTPFPRLTPGQVTLPVVPLSGRVTVLILLSDPPLVQIIGNLGVDSTSKDVAQQLAQIKVKQAHLLGTLIAAPFNARVLITDQVILNAVVISVEASQLAAIRQLDGVAAVYVLRERVVQSAQGE